MTSRYPILYRSIQGLALAVVLAGILLPGLVAQSQLLIAVALIVLVGIPHGATDYLIFQYLSRPLWGSRQMMQFYLHYVLLMAGYGLLWWLLPEAALTLFLALSMYHFGQSNWNYISFDKKWLEYTTHALWGAFVVLTPILWHYERSAVIIESIIGSTAPELSKAWCEAICIVLLVSNLFLSFYFLLQQKISRKEFLDELANYAILALLFVNTPVLLGFAIYFVCWHSLSSVMDQIRFFRQHKGRYSVGDYILNTLPLSVVAIASLGGMAWLQSSIGMGISIGIVFIFISVVTLPHMILIDQLYQELPSKESIEKSMFEES